MLPHDREQDALQTVRHDLRLQPPKHQSLHAALSDHPPHHRRVAQRLLRALLVHLNHPDAVGARVADGRTAESHDGAPSRLAEGIVLLGYLF